MQPERRDWVTALALTALSAALLLPNLGNSFLWQDEAQTAVVARTILSDGVPRGTDGLNFFSQEQGREYGPNHLWKWHTWLAFYLTAASFLALGETTTAARLPFALLAIATVVLAYFTGLRFWRDRRAALASAGLLAVSVPYLILSRQCRYYAAVSFFSLLGLHAYVRLRDGGRGAAWWLFAAAVLLFHTHYLYAATLLATLIAHAALLERERLSRVLWVTAATVAVDLPWIVWFADIRPGGEGYLASLGNFAKLANHAARYTGLTLRWIFEPALLLVLPALALWRWRAGEPAFRVERETWHNAALLALYAVVTVLLLSLLSPLVFYRYLAPLFPPAFLLSGLLVGRLLRRSLALGLAVVAALLATGSLQRHLYELSHDYDGPIEGIVRFLEAHAEPGDVVAISYGDMPLKFYTRLRIVGGLTGEDLAPARQARWIIIRRHNNTEEDTRVKRELRKIVEAGGYRAHALDVPDTPFENRESPDVHRFRSAPKRMPPVLVFEKRR